MNVLGSFLTVVGLTLFVAPVRAQTLDPASKEALEKTQQLLKNADERNKAVSGNPQGQQAVKQVNDIAGSPENAQKIFELAADVMGSLAQQTGGDPVKMQQMMDQAQRDPASLANKLTPEQLAKLKEIGKAIESRSQPKQP